jgi:hypothetical protein
VVPSGASGPFSLGFPARHGTNDMDDASWGPPLSKSKSHARRHAMAPSRLRNTSDILRSRVSPWWRIPCSTRSLARRMLEKQTSARQAQHVRWWGLSTLSRCQLTGDSTPQPSRTSRLPSALPTSRIGLRPSNHDTSGFPCTCALCHHARLAALLVTCATQDLSPSDHVGVIARLGRYLDLV